MKKISFLAVLMALTVSIVFGSISLSSAGRPPAPPTTSGAVHMDTISGSVNVSNGSQWPLSFTYPQTRHVSITVLCFGVDNAGTDNVTIYNTMIADSPWYYSPGSVQPGDDANAKTLEFDTDNWAMEVQDRGGESSNVFYKVTVTYPQ